MTPGVYLWRGRTYIGRKAVAQAAGVHIVVVDYHLRTHGNLDRLGVGQRRAGARGPVKPVEAYGRVWPSRLALARELGVSHTTAARWVNHDPDRLLSALMAADARKAGFGRAAA